MLAFLLKDGQVQLPMRCRQKDLTIMFQSDLALCIRKTQLAIPAIHVSGCQVRYQIRYSSIQFNDQSFISPSYWLHQKYNLIKKLAAWISNRIMITYTNMSAPYAYIIYKIRWRFRFFGWVWICVDPTQTNKYSKHKLRSPNNRSFWTQTQDSQSSSGWLS